MIRLALLFPLLICLHVEISEQISPEELGLTISNSVKGAPQIFLENKSKVIKKSRSLRARQDILRNLQRCEDMAGADILGKALDIVKHKDFTTGGKIREQKAEECFDQMRPKVNAALDAGYIEPLQDPRCPLSGWGSFRLYKASRATLIDTHRRLPCGDKRKQ